MPTKVKRIQPELADEIERVGQLQAVVALKGLPDRPKTMAELHPLPDEIGDDEPEEEDVTPEPQPKVDDVPPEPPQSMSNRDIPEPPSDAHRADVHPVTSEPNQITKEQLQRQLQLIQEKLNLMD